MRRGLLLNLISNVAFFIAGYAIHWFLGGFASPADYGVVGTVITVLDFEYLFVSNGARQSLSRNIASRRYDGRRVIVRTIAVQAAIVAAFFLADFAGAPLFGLALGGGTLERYFRYAAFLVPANGMYVVLLGINDGLQRFGRSAFLSTFYPMVKLGTIPLIILVFPHEPVIGVEVGYCAAMVLTILVGLVMLVPVWRSLPAGDGDAFPWRTAAHGVLSFSLFFIMASLVLSADTLVVKAELPDRMAGYYTGAMNFGKTTYYLLQAFAVIILPVVSRLIAASRRDEAVVKARGLFLLAFALVAPMAVTISATAPDLLAAFYSDRYVVGAPALSCLAFSSFFMGITVILNMTLNAERDTRFSDLLSLVCLPVVLAVFVLAAKAGGITALAAASMACTALIMVVSYAETRRRFGDVMGRKAWRAVACDAALWVVMSLLSRVLDVGSFLTLMLLYAVLYAAFVALLIPLGVLEPARIRAMLTQRDRTPDGAAANGKDGN
ncbi:lipopolysaccharide biosynthesis protein [Bifidobacterium saguinibicoloris]|uniref:lipopolysaccharide biosynthesis protein n=1 Tax=Bifidobacterium saguinibicoloris TaxID=2834433 RepID=UPI001C5A05C4|nr:lipopolysaccharide biosynthesis protein [Bifidobacterium saguinibicoloris]MBW3080030.1 lipopolysaccharide biosynthesis protein [Bifidobacterium saguinibicoloris]